MQTCCARMCVCVLLDASLFLAVIGVAPVTALLACFGRGYHAVLCLELCFAFCAVLNMHASLLFWQVPQHPSCHESCVFAGQHSCPGHHQAICQPDACEHSTIQLPNVLWDAAYLSVYAGLHKHAVSVTVLWRPAADQLCGWLLLSALPSAA